MRTEILQHAREWVSAAVARGEIVVAPVPVRVVPGAGAERKKKTRVRPRGRCVDCWGNAAVHVRCERCHEKHLAKARARSGFQPWVPGGKGRPPLCLKIAGGGA